MRKLLARFLTLLIATVLIGACGGGGGGGSGGSDSDGGSSFAPTIISGTGIVVGPVSGFGSIFVNGILFDTIGAIFTRNSLPATEDHFSVGDVASITGTLNGDGTGTATAVAYHDVLRGAVTAITTNGAPEVLGQQIETDNLTLFEDFESLSELTVNSVVDVSGLVTETGNIHARRITLLVSTNTSTVTGIVTGLDTTGQTFTLGKLTIDYASATLTNSNAGALQNGLLVTVSTTQPVSTSMLIAESVEFAGQQTQGTTGDLVEVEGFVSNLLSNGDFSIAGQLVAVRSTTQIENGTASNIGNGSNVEAEGALDEIGRIVASTIKLRPTSQIHLHADVDAVDTGNNTITLLGTVATVNNLTIRKDKSALGIKTFNLQNVSPGDKITIDGYARTGGTLVATTLKREITSNEIEIRGPASNPNEAAGMVNVLGTTFGLQASSQIKDAMGNTITSAAFFAGLVPGVTLLEIKATPSGINLALIDEVSIDDDVFEEVD